MTSITGALTPGRRRAASFPAWSVIVLVALLMSGACGGSPPSDAPASAGTSLQINGAGATFPYPLYSKWFDEYHKLHPDVLINYQPAGSGGGIRQLLNETVFFGATEGPVTDQELAAAARPILHFPTVIGAVVPVYNIPGVKADVKFSGALLADIFLGNVKRWNDPAIVALNPGLTLPAADLTVVHRSDGSGTTYVWVDYLSKVSPEWKSRVGVSTSVNWPKGVGGKGNEGVSALVAQTPGAIGYVELVYAVQNRISYGAVQNPAGAFVKASVDSVNAAAATAVADMPADFRISITNAAGEGSYPIASYSWLLLYADSHDQKRSQVMVDFLKWALSDGQQFATTLGYSPLPAPIIQRELAQLARIRTS